MPTRDEQSRRISGRIIDGSSRQGRSHLRVEAWDKNVIAADARLGAAMTGPDGAFVIEVSRSAWSGILDRQPDVFFKVFQESELILSSEESVLRNVADDIQDIVLELDGARIPAIRQAGTGRSFGRADDNPFTTLRPALHSVTHEVFGQLLNRETAKPLAGLTVRAYDLDEAAPKDLGYDLTDGRGRFALAYTTRNGASSNGSRRLRFDVSDETLSKIYEETVSVASPQESVLKLRVPVEPKDRPLEIQQLGSRLRLSPAVQAELARQNIRTLADIRRGGGLRHRPDLSLPADDPSVLKLEAHAYLDLLSNDVDVTTALIDKGYMSLSAIARKTPSDFIAQFGGELGEAQAARLHHIADAQSKFLNAQATARTMERVNGFDAGSEPESRFPPREQYQEKLFACNCDDCESAVSPMAYLADLLDYAITHVKIKHGNPPQFQPITISYLLEEFHQPFDQLPVSCEEMDKKVHQVRICIEVLRRFLGPSHLLPPLQQRRYCTDAYQTLLFKVGTSYEELRLARTAEADARQALADKLGIDLGSARPDHLDQLLLDPETITEGALQDRFGLVDTTKEDPLDPVPVPKLQTWRLQHLRTVWKDQDWPFDPYIEATAPHSQDTLLPIIDPDLIGPDDFRHPVAKPLPVGPEDPFDLWLKRRAAVDTLLASIEEVHREQGIKAALVQTFGPIPLEPYFNKLNNGINPEVTQAEIEDDLHLTVDAFTRLMTVIHKDTAFQNSPKNPSVSDEEWRDVYSILADVQKQKLFPAWIAEEQPRHTLFSFKNFWLSVREPREGEWPPAFLTHQPLIDPDRIKAEDLPAARGGKTGVRLWQGRKAQLDGIGATLKDRSEGPDGFDAMLLEALGHPNAGDPLPYDVEILQHNATNHIDMEATRTAIEEDLHLTVPDFLQLMYVRAKSEQPELSKKPTSQEWALAFRMLTTASKLKRLYSAWRDEEQGLPLIDPELLKIEDLPDGEIGQAARDLWTTRKDSLDSMVATLKSMTHGPTGLTTILQQVFGQPLPQDFETLGTALTGTDDHQRADAVKVVTGELYLTVEDFTHLMTVKAKDDQPDPGIKPTPDELAELCPILTTAHKQRTWYEQWAGEESTARLTSQYWRALKATLPRWRASQARRSDWRQALRRRGHVLVDPDLIDDTDVNRRIAGKPADDRRIERQEQLSKQVFLLTTSRAASTAGDLTWFNQQIQSTIGVPASVLEALNRDYEDGVDIVARLEQLNLTYDAFLYLIKVGKLLTAGEPVLNTEWLDVYAILVNVWKQRESAEWQFEEQQAGFILSPDYFKIPDPPPFDEFPPPDPKVLNVWRATWDAYFDWQGTLQARLDQERAVIDALQAAVSATEETTLPWLRDTLIMITNANGNSLEAKAKWLTKVLLIDAQNSGAFQTTRVAQAIETVQGLISSLRSNLLSDTRPDLELVDYSDEEWEWIGSYTTYRAAMFVFLYPENILIPTLKRHQTPAFRSLVSALRSNRQLTPKQACEAAGSYSDYFGDICSLQVEATCHALTQIRRSDCTSPEGYADLFYMFARGESATVYWSAYDAEDKSGYDQTFWDAVPGMENVTKIVGAAPYFPGFQARIICLFGQKLDKGVPKLVMAKYNCETQTWDSEPIELELPKQEESETATITVVLKQTAREDATPHLAFRLPSGAVYDRVINRGATDWAGDWHVLMDATKGKKYAALHALVESKLNTFFMFVSDNKHNRLRYSLWTFSEDQDVSSLGNLGSGPAVCTRGIDQEDVFIRADTNRLMTRPMNKGQWEGEWIDLELDVSSDPCAIAMPEADQSEPGRIDVFVRGADFSIVHLHSTDGFTTPPGIENLGGVVSSGPAAVMDKTQQHWAVFARGLDNALWWTSSSSDNQTWLQLDSTHITSDPAAAAWVWGDSVEDDIVYVVSRGTDNTLLRKRGQTHGHWSDSSHWTWSEWVPLGGELTSGVSITVIDQGKPGEHHLYQIYVAARTKDNTVQYKTFTKATNTWSDWQDIGGKAMSDPKVTGHAASATTTALDPDTQQYVEITDLSSRVCIYMRGADGHLRRSLYIAIKEFLDNEAAKIREQDDLDDEDKNEKIKLLQSLIQYFGWERPGGEALSDEKNVLWFDLYPGVPEHAQWLGASMVGESNEVYAFWKEGASTFSRLITADGAFNLSNPAMTSLERVAVDCGPPPRNVSDKNLLDRKWLAYQLRDYGQGVNLGGFRGRFRATNSLLWHQRHLPLHPLVWSEPARHVAVTVEEEALQSRRFEIQSTFTQNLAYDVPCNLIYLKEAYYFVPIYLALQLQQQGHYVEALDWFRTTYDFTAPRADRKIYYGLALEEEDGDGDVSGVFTRPEDWLLDPLNPHDIAENRRLTYTRFTMLGIIRCLLDFADGEFTRDTAESVPRARILYMKALELLEARELKQRMNGCAELIGTITIELGPDDGQPYYRAPLEGIKDDLRAIGQPSVLDKVTKDVKAILAGPEPLAKRIDKAEQRVAVALAERPSPRNFSTLLAERPETRVQSEIALLTDPKMIDATVRVGKFAASTYSYDGDGSLENDLPRDADDWKWTALHHGQGASAGSSRPDVGSKPKYVPITSFDFCIGPNPVIKALRLHAELNLYKIRNCRNIAGLERQLDPYAAPTDQFSGLPMIGAGGQLVLPGVAKFIPTPYRYKALIERARQLVQVAAQIEASMLSAFEKHDAEQYSRKKAQQDMRLTKAGVRLQDLRVTEAEGGVRLAELQRDKAQMAADHYEKLLEEPISEFEYGQLTALITASFLQGAAAVTYFAAAALPSFVTDIKDAIARMNASASGFSSSAGVASTLASWYAARASFERRRQDWEFQQTLALQDVLIGTQQVKIAEQHVQVVGQERQIAKLQAEFAEVNADFLATKFTNAELYEWMSDVLLRVYSYFLQQATSGAQVAASQLAFERQEVPPPYIQADYWEPPNDSGATVGEGKAVDRRGLTGSARLFQDITQLDQYAFETTQLKLQLSYTLPLALAVPVEFQRFRETGVLVFSTPMELWDRCFPGHYLRLIKRVRTTVVALIPPSQGIRATLTHSGTSRVVIGGDIFQTVIVRRSPQSVALTSPRDATGVFELEQQSDLLLPFENIGVDTTWEFRMPRAANAIDYGTIADILITIDYTALDSYDYRQQVIQSLRPTQTSERPFSLRHQFADQWYDLHNADLTATPMTVRFDTRREDYAPNLTSLKIQHVALYFSRKSGKTFEIPVTYLRFTEEGGQGAVGGGGQTIDGLISTRSGNGGSWTPIIGKAPFGTWELAFPDMPIMKSRFKNEEIEDILFVITYSGRTPDWPA